MPCYRNIIRATVVVTTLLVANSSLAAPAAEATRKTDSEPVFARVGDVVIGLKEYDNAFAIAARNKFYHGKPPEIEVAKLQREVGDKLINNVLLLKEARKRGMQPDAKTVQGTIDGYEAQYKTSEQWKKNRDQLLPGLRKKLEDDNLLAQLEKIVRTVPEPEPKQVEAYYQAHKDKFTEPEQLATSVILLKVDPSSPKAKWEAAKEEAEAILKRLRGGADFAQLANLHSGDPSAQQGGDLGYLHRGMVPTPAQEALDKLQAGGLSGPVVLLEGVAVFRLNDRKAARLNPLSAVRERAGDLLQRDQSEAAWTAFIAKLRKEASVKVDESKYLPLAVSGAGKDGPSQHGASAAR